MGFDESQHQRDDKGRFIDTGGQKLKAWGKSRGDLKGFQSGKSVPPELIDGVKKWMDAHDAHEGGIGLSGGANAPQKIRADLEQKFGRDAFSNEANKQLGIEVNNKSDAQFVRSHGRYADQYHEEGAPYGQYAPQMQPGGVHGDRDRITDVRTKEEQPKGGTSDWAPPKLVHSPQELFHRFGNEQKITDYEKSPVLTAALAKEKTIHNLNEQDEKLKEKAGNLDRDVNDAQMLLEEARSLPTNAEDRAKYWTKLDTDKDGTPNNIDSIPARVRQYFQWGYGEDGHPLKGGALLEKKQYRWYPNEKMLGIIEDKEAHRDEVGKLVAEVRDQRRGIKNQIKQIQNDNARAVSDFLRGEADGELGVSIHEEATESWVNNVYEGTALNMQKAANEMGIKWTGARGNTGESGIMGAAIEAKRGNQGDIKVDELKPYMKKQYNLSQASLRLAGYKPGDKITLYRGIQNLPEGAKVGSHVSIDTRPLSSWTDKKTIADTFGTVVSAQVPVEQVFTNYRLFKNTYNENEYVVLDGANLRMKLEAKYK